MLHGEKAAEYGGRDRRDDGHIDDAAQSRRHNDPKSGLGFRAAVRRLAYRAGLFLGSHLKTSRLDGPDTPTVAPTLDDFLYLRVRRVSPDHVVTIAHAFAGIANFSGKRKLP
jgi:hypothetical protein